MTSANNHYYYPAGAVKGDDAGETREISEAGTHIPHVISRQTSLPPATVRADAAAVTMRSNESSESENSFRVVVELKEPPEDVSSDCSGDLETHSIAYYLFTVPGIMLHNIFMCFSSASNTLGRLIPIKKEVSGARKIAANLLLIPFGVLWLFLASLVCSFIWLYSMILSDSQSSAPLVARPWRGYVKWAAAQ
ncbi:hypothetical protein CANCADRAFT_126992 [Tortispora caseinolytica NRRL Y-17796]|uniref:Uncharacterized protein n=1 Tax=Tortispora caseinolytica NRRL Y-17796 TaxID=767744 RepID=A0A1E4TA46_9ASCO|nr:hypothetical protein CANCADRAFT_126992 [Tortispora caseinolytica NRRL Y-17796]